MNIDIGSRLRKYRQSHKWSQTELAQRAGLSPTYIGMLERGEKIPKIETLYHLSELLGVNICDFLQPLPSDSISAKLFAYAEKIKNLPSEEQDRIFSVLDALLFI